MAQSKGRTTTRVTKLPLGMFITPKPSSTTPPFLPIPSSSLISPLFPVQLLSVPQVLPHPSLQSECIRLVSALPYGGINARDTRTKVQVQPFSFDQRDKAKLEQKQQKIKKVRLVVGGGFVIF